MFTACVLSRLFSWCLVLGVKLLFAHRLTPCRVYLVFSVFLLLTKEYCCCFARRLSHACRTVHACKQHPAVPVACTIPSFERMLFYHYAFPRYVHFCMHAFVRLCMYFCMHAFAHAGAPLFVHFGASWCQQISRVANSVKGTEGNRRRRSRRGPEPQSHLHK